MIRAHVNQLLLKNLNTRRLLWLPILTYGLAALPTYANDIELLSAPLNLKLSETTVSGLSSGGYMASQMHIAHSDWIQGAGIIAAGPLYCAQNSLTTALSDCIGAPKKAVDLQGLNQVLNQWESEHKISDWS